MNQIQARYQTTDELSMEDIQESLDTFLEDMSITNNFYLTDKSIGFAFGGLPFTSPIPAYNFGLIWLEIPYNRIEDILAEQSLIKKLHVSK